METTSIISILSMAFGLGMLHALDADHVMAVSSLSSTRPGWRASLKFCIRWAVGHGLSLFIIGTAVLLFGLSIPVELSAFAESLIGIVLIAIGLYVIWDLVRKNAHLHFHNHDDLTDHAHWHKHDNKREKQQGVHAKDSHAHNHGAVMVGVLHGTAGSAPLLALIPLAQMGSPWLGVFYISLFGVGVLLSMLLFGGLLGGLYTGLSKWGTDMVRFIRGSVGISSIGFGGYLLYGVL